MVRVSKQDRRRNVSPRKHKNPALKTGPKQDNLPLGYKAHENAVTSEAAKSFFIPKIK